MSDFKKKIEQLKKEREARSRKQKTRRDFTWSEPEKKSDDTDEFPSVSGKTGVEPKAQRVRETWETINKGNALSTREKLQQLINLTRSDKTKESHTPRREPQEREPLKLIENPFPLNTRYGKVTLSSALDIKGDVLACLSKDDSFRDIDLSTALFIDLETTGLSGGTGTVPFNIGMGYFRDDSFWVVQYFLGELAEEERMIQELEDFFRTMDFQSVVTYNGKNFDIPLLETRFILHRRPFPLGNLPHLDFLYPARSLWRHKHDNCRLSHLAHEVVRTGRTEDIPSAEIPWRYFQYLQTGNYDLIEPVIYHNQEDILSLLGVVIMGALIFSEEGEECPADAMDFYGAGKVMEKIGDVEKSVRYYERALGGSLSDEVVIEAKKKLSYHFKRNEEWEKAISLWKEVMSLEVFSAQHLFSFREMAMYLEHKERNYDEAKKIAEEGYVLSLNTSSYYEDDFKHRMERLKQKISAKSEPEKE
ncbi:MAG: ribonuclease H-like domain-containing protein [Candidatus Aminicenantes bacterium]|nr:ribonuclease H-like domain-containing protein [Candidatus Aminicenantes bacterium]